jgi:hypothetical protein
MGARFKRAGFVLGVALALAAAPQASAAKPGNGCNTGLFEASGQSTPVELPGSLEAPILSSFGVFRRAALPGDQLPLLSSAGSEIEGQLSGFYAGEIRLLARLPGGGRLFVVPGLPRLITFPPARCLPKSLRSKLPAMIEFERKRSTQPEYCLIEIGTRRGIGSTGECAPFADVASSSRLFLLSLFPSPGPIALLVPDGVASVRMTGPGRRVTTIPVSENAYLYTPAPGSVHELSRAFRRLANERYPKHPTKRQRRRAEREFRKVTEEALEKTTPGRVEWLNAAGSVLRTVKRPVGLLGGGLSGVVVGG